MLGRRAATNGFSRLGGVDGSAAAAYSVAEAAGVAENGATACFLRPAAAERYLLLVR